MKSTKSNTNKILHKRAWTSDRSGSLATQCNPTEIAVYRTWFADYSSDVNCPECISLDKSKIKRKR